MTVVDLAKAYVEVALKDRATMLKQIQELSDQVNKLDAHILECKATIEPPVTAADPVAP